MTTSDFSNVIEKYWDTVFRIALNHFGNKSDAEDAVQEVMLKFYESACVNDKSFESGEHIRNWLIRVTINVCKSTLRSFWHRRRSSLEELTEALSFDNTGQSKFFLTVMSLPEHHRTVLYLYYYEDLTAREIAEIFRTTEAHIRTRLSRARNKFKEVWQDE